MNKYLYIFLIICFVSSNSIIGLSGSIWQILAIVISLIFVCSRGIKNFSIPTIAFFICCLISIGMNQIPAYFKPYERLAQYILVLLTVSPIIRSNGIDSYRMKLFEVIAISFGIISLGSFIAKFMGVGLSTIGYFGLSFHPNFLGYFAMITCIVLFALFFLSEEKKYKIVLGSLVVISFLVILLSAARICLAGSILGCLVFLGLKYRGRILKLVSIVFVLAVIAIAALPLYEPYLEGIIYKQTAAEIEESATSSRDAIWATRMEEIRRYPVFGVGCFSVDTTIESDDTFYNPFNPFMGTVELGSTYLGVMSQTGILGFICFMLVFLGALFKCYKASKETDSIIPKLLLAIFTSIALHMLVEGYATQAGSMQCVVLWLLFSCMMASPEIMEEEEEAIVEKLGIEEEDDDEDEEEDEEEDDEEEEEKEDVRKPHFI